MWTAMHVSDNSKGKRSRADLGDDDEMEITIDTELYVRDSLKRICLDSPRTGDSKATQGNVFNWAASVGGIERGRDDAQTTECVKFKNRYSSPLAEAYSPSNPLRRPRGHLDESFDNIVRKHRRVQDTTTAQNHEYMGMQLVPVGPDPLQDRRILSAYIKTGKNLITAGDVNSIGINCQTTVQRSAVLETTDNISRDNSYYANDISHSDWVLFLEGPELGNTHQPATGFSAEEGVPMES
jgi:hypothetical protein